MPIEDLVEAPAEPEPEEGQVAYEAICNIVADLKPTELMALVSAVQRRDPWARVPPVVRDAFADLELELFEDDTE